MSAIWSVALGFSLLLAAAAIAASAPPPLRRAPQPRTRNYGTIDPGPRQPYVLDRVPRPADQGAATQSPLEPFLAKALDRALPATGQGRSVNWTHEEVHDLASRVVLRINSRNPGLGLALVSFDAVTKTVDAYETLHYEFDAQVHALPRNLSARVTVRVDVTSDDTDYIRDISVHGSKTDASEVRGSGGLNTHVAYATYEPVLTYEPQFE